LPPECAQGQRLRLARAAGLIGQRSRGLDVADRELAGLAVFLSVEGDLLTLVEAVQARALKRGRVDEYVLADPRRAG